MYLQDIYSVTFENKEGDVEEVKEYVDCSVEDGGTGCYTIYDLLEAYKRMGCKVLGYSRLG